jgi:hypothetical protein
VLRRPVESRHPLRAVADALHLTCTALRARLARLPRRTPGSREVRVDGFRFVRVGARWIAYASPPWTVDGSLRRWRSLPDTAATLGVPQATLRRQLDRRVARNNWGVLWARLRGLIACKFGDTWRFTADDGEPDLG